MPSCFSTSNEDGMNSYNLNIYLCKGDFLHDTLFIAVAEFDWGYDTPEVFHLSEKHRENITPSDAEVGDDPVYAVTFYDPELNIEMKFVFDIAEGMAFIYSISIVDSERGEITLNYNDCADWVEDEYCD